MLKAFSSFKQYNSRQKREDLAMQCNVVEGCDLQWYPAINYMSGTTPVTAPWPSFLFFEERLIFYGKK